MEMRHAVALQHGVGKMGFGQGIHLHRFEYAVAAVIAVDTAQLHIIQSGRGKRMGCIVEVRDVGRSGVRVSEIPQG